ncbi:MAG: VCBS repeat-containing protein [Myxococcales bacterium]|nr:VCBS repeat-containing protein [Myxococcales bacterium]
MRRANERNHAVSRASRLWAGFALLSTFTFEACGGASGGEQHDEGLAMSRISQVYTVWDKAESYLISQAPAGSTVDVCLKGSGVTSTTRSIYERHVRSAVMAWIDGVRPASSVRLIGDTDVRFSCDRPHVTINWSAASGRANAGRGIINMFAGDDYEVVLHEFGHVFGIGDTYVEGIWSCQPGQENSVMCGSGGLFMTLQRDDTNAIQEVFCLTFPGSCRRRVAMDLNWCSQANGQLHAGDFNGDGRTDMLCHDVGDGHKWIAYANSAGQFTGTNWEVAMSWCSHANGRLHTSDFNGDGRTDLLCHDVGDGHKWIAYANSAGQFTGTNWEADMNWCSQANGRLHTGDFNGDGRTDLLCHDVGDGHKWIAYANSVGQFTGTNWEADMNWCSHANGRLHTGDFNGDGRTDLLCHDVSDGYKWIATAGAAGAFAGTSRSWPMNWCKHPGAQFFTGDFDGNGATDFLCHDPATGYKWIAQQSP